MTSYSRSLSNFRRRSALLKASILHHFDTTKFVHVKIDVSNEAIVYFLRRWRHSIIEISASTMNEEDFWEREFRSTRQSDVVATISANVSINSSLSNAKITIIMLLQVISMRSRKRCKDQTKRLCSTKDFQLKQILRVRMSFKSKSMNEKQVSRVRVSFKSKKNKEFARLLTTRN